MTGAPPSPPEGVDYTKRWWVLVAIAMGVFLGTIDGSIVNAALPTLADQLDTSFAAVQWVVLGYVLTQSTLVLGFGRLGDMLGKKRIYTAGFVVFTAASLLAGISPGVGWLIAFRVVQALGASMIFALGFAIVTESFPSTERGRALGLIGTIVSIGIAIGPAVGGIVIEYLSWRWIFFVNLPVGFIGVLTARRFIPDVPPPGGQRFDYAGGATFFAGLLGLMLGLTLAQETGFSDPLVLASFVAAAVFLTTFIAIERRVRQPMLDLALFSDRLLTVNLVNGFMSFAAILGVLFLMPFYLQEILGFTPQQMGLLLAAPSIALGIISPISGAVSDRVGQRPVTVVGLAVMVLAYLGATTFGADTTAAGYVAVALGIGLGVGIFQSPNNSAVLGSVPPHRLGVTSGLLTITRLTGQLSGIAVFATVWATRVGVHSGGATDPRTAPQPAQVEGLQDTMLIISLWVAVALGLAIWNLRSERRRTREAAAREI